MNCQKVNIDSELSKSDTVGFSRRNSMDGDEKGDQSVTPLKDAR
jgi:hypothetical protein